MSAAASAPQPDRITLENKARSFVLPSLKESIQNKVALLLTDPPKEVSGDMLSSLQQKKMEREYKDWDTFGLTYCARKLRSEDTPGWQKPFCFVGMLIASPFAGISRIPILGDFLSIVTGHYFLTCHMREKAGQNVLPDEASKLHVRRTDKDALKSLNIQLEAAIKQAKQPRNSPNSENIRPEEKENELQEIEEICSLLTEYKKEFADRYPHASVLKEFNKNLEEYFGLILTRLERSLPSKKFEEVRGAGAQKAKDFVDAAKARPTVTPTQPPPEETR